MIGKIEQLTDSVSSMQKILNKLEKKFGDQESFKWDLYITKVDNGFILTPGDNEESPEVIECDGDERDTMQELLIAVYNQFSSMDTGYNKWKNDNLRISWDEEGHKYEEPYCMNCYKVECDCIVPGGA